MDNLNLNYILNVTGVVIALIVVIIEVITLVFKDKISKKKMGYLNGLVCVLAMIIVFLSFFGSVVSSRT